MAKEKKEKIGPAKPLTPQESKKVLTPMFREYDALAAGVQKARDALEAAVAARSLSVERIARAGGTGPFKRGDKELSVMRRPSKDDPAKVTWFFRGETEAVVTSID